MESLLFWFFSVIAVVSAVLMVCFRNPLMGALSLAISFLATAGLFALMTGPFVAIMQVLVYAGAIMVLVIFVIMLLRADEASLDRERIGPFRFALGALIGLPFGGFLLVAVGNFGGKVEAATSALPPDFGSMKSFGRMLFNQYMYPFEIVSILLLVAIIGVVVLAKRDF